MARLPATGRTPVSTRLGIRNYPYSLQYANGLHAVSLTGNSISGSGAFTMAQWVKFNFLNPGQFRITLDIGGPTISPDFYMGIDQSNFVFYGGTSFGLNVPSTTKINLNTWYFMVVTYAGGASGALKMYLNNSLILSTNQTLNIGGTDITEGDIVGLGDNSLAQIAQTVIWTRALTATELSNLYYFGFIPSSGLMVQYNHTNGSGSTITDNSGNGFDLAISGTPVWMTDSPIKSRS